VCGQGVKGKSIRIKEDAWFPCCGSILLLYTKCWFQYENRFFAKTANIVARAKVSLDCVFTGPFLCCAVVSFTIRFVDVSNLWHKRVVWVGVRKHRTDGQENFADGQGRAPLVPENVQADATVGVDIWVIYARGEVDLWRLERVVCRKVYREEEDTSAVAGIRGSHDGSLPVKQIVAHRSGGA